MIHYFRFNLIIHVGEEIAYWGITMSLFSYRQLLEHALRDAILNVIKGFDFPY
jgi:hypothetical protein